MGGTVSKNERRRRKKKKNISEKHVMNLKEKVRVLQEGIKATMREREKESRDYERDVMVFAFKEADWEQEGKRMREEVRHLRKLVEEKEERIREMEKKEIIGNHNNNVNVNVDDDDDEKKKKMSEREWELIGTKVLVEQMREERVRRDGAVEKWKQLYLAIKTELDDLIHSTYHAREGLYWKAEEKDMEMENLKREVQEKEETIKALKTELVSMEKEKCKKEREFDLLRQSLRIMNGKKCSSIHTKEKLIIKSK